MRAGPCSNVEDLEYGLLAISLRTIGLSNRRVGTKTVLRCPRTDPNMDRMSKITLSDSRNHLIVLKTEIVATKQFLGYCGDLINLHSDFAILP